MNSWPISASTGPLSLLAADTVEDALSDPAVIVITQSHQLFLDGLALYKGCPDKGYSLTDCISMQVMRREGITEILTHDAHFTQGGFTILALSAFAESIGPGEDGPHGGPGEISMRTIPTLLILTPACPARRTADPAPTAKPSAALASDRGDPAGASTTSRRRRSPTGPGEAGSSARRRR